MKKEIETLIEEHRTGHIIIDGRDYGEFKVPPNVAYEDLIAKGILKKED